MSMLAEKKRRTKWATNPRGNLWSNDNNKFGQKLLEKMGWSPGQGLGVQNQGRSDVLRIQFKNDNKGLGFNGNDENWLKHQQEFNNILTKLAEKNRTDEVITPVENKPESLELKSSQSRRRIHYHKFTRGKDLSQYSEKDLAAILGIPVGKTVNSDVVDNTNHINAGSMEDYFKEKQLGFKRNTQDGVADVGIRSMDEGGNSIHDDTEAHHSAGSSENANDQKMLSKISNESESKKKMFLQNEGLEGQNNANGENLIPNNNERNENVSKKKRKLKNKDRDIEENNQVHNDIHIMNMNDCVEVNLKVSKKKSKSPIVKDKTIVEDNYDYFKEKKQKIKVNGSGDTLKRKSKSEGKGKHLDNDFEDNDKPAKKKRKLREERLGNVEDCDKANDEVSNTWDTINSTSEKKKLNMLEVETDMLGQNVIQNENYKQSKKAKKNKTLSSDDICRTDIVDEEKEQKKKTKGRPKESSSVNEIANEENNDIENEEKKRKVNIKESSLVNDIAIEENNDIESGKKKSKKKKKQKRRLEKDVLQNDTEVCNQQATETLIEINHVENVESKKLKKLSKKSKCKMEVEVQEDVACNNDETKTKQIDEGIKTIGMFKKKVDYILGEYKKVKETKKLTETSKTGEGSISYDFVSLNDQPSTNFSGDNFPCQANFNSNETDYKSYYSKPLNQYSYNSLRDNGQSFDCRNNNSYNYNNGYNNNYRGGSNFNSRASKQPSDIVAVKQYYAKYKLVITEPELDFKGANVSEISGYGKLKK